MIVLLEEGCVGPRVSSYTAVMVYFNSCLRATLSVFLLTFQSCHLYHFRRKWVEHEIHEYNQTKHEFVTLFCNWVWLKLYSQIIKLQTILKSELFMINKTMAHIFIKFDENLQCDLKNVGLLNSLHMMVVLCLVILLSY